MDRQLQLLTRAGAGIRIDRFDIFLARWRDQADRDFRDERNAKAWRSNTAAIEDVGSEIRSLNFDIQRGLGALGDRVDAMGNDVLAGIRQQTAQLISSQRQLFTDQVAWDQHQSSFAYRACRTASALVVAREVTALRADLDELNAAAESVLTRITPVYDSCLEVMAKGEAVSTAESERLRLDEQLDDRRGDLARLKRASGPKGGILGIFRSSQPTSEQLMEIVIAERDITLLVGRLASIDTLKSMPQRGTKIRAAAALRARKELLEQTSTSGDLNVASQLLALPPALLKAVPPAIDYDIARACEEAEMTEYPGFGTIPAKKDMPGMLIELKTLSAGIATFPYGNPLRPRIESVELLRAFFEGNEDSFLEHWRVTSVERQRDRELEQRASRADEDDAEGGVMGGGESDALYDQAVGVVLQNKRASISLVQRHLRIGYNRAARLLEQMERSGLVGPMSTNGNRDIIAPNRTSE